MAKNRSNWPVLSIGPEGYNSWGGGDRGQDKTTFVSVHG